ncbi:MAG TPA: ABATE domain-containing protein [Ktedonobacterales bacterium]|nr:ABATE domain-containing protein [Ktedonobacterales bacterium]
METAKRERIPDDGADHFALVAGSVCLDFVNTVGGLRGAQTEERLTSYADLTRWCRQAGVLTQDVTDGLLREAERRPDEARAVLIRALALREALYGILLAGLDGARCSEADLAILNGELAGGLARTALAQTSAGFTWRWNGGERRLDRMLGDIARSAADLLLSAQTSALRQCASDTCGWLFLDTTKNHSRRWCEMRACGNRDKVRRHRARKRPERSA